MWMPLFDGLFQEVHVISDTGLENLRRDMQSLVDEGKRAGVVWGVAHKGALLALEAAGYRNLEAQMPMEVQTRFRLYSMTRAPTAVVVLGLAERGMLKLDDPISQYIPAFADTPVISDPGGEPPALSSQESALTIYHLLTYTSGLGYPYDYPDGVDASFEKVLPLGSTLEAGINALARVPLLFQPGYRWFYGYSGDVLGRVAEVVAESSYNDLMEARVLGPLGMAHTGFSIAEADRDQLAEAYRLNPEGQLVNATGTLPVTNSYRETETLFSGGGGLVGTAEDYLRFGQMLLNRGELDGNRVLTPGSVTNMVRNHLSEAQLSRLHRVTKSGAVGNPMMLWPGYGWGLSIGVRLDNGEHGVPGGRGEVRWDGLANTTFFVDPENEIVAVAMAQFLAFGDLDLDRALRRNLYGQG